MFLWMIFIIFFGVGTSEKNEGQIKAAYVGIFDNNYEKMMEKRDKIPWGVFDRIYIAFATLDKYGNLTDISNVAEYKIKNITSLYRKANPNGEVFISSNYGYDMDSRYLAAASHPEEFSLSVLKYLEKYQLDGYDMDWETAAINTYSNQLVLLLKSCKSRFQTKYKLIHTVWLYIHNETTVGQLSGIVDGINIMCYGAWGNDLVLILDKFYNNSFPYEKMLIGVESEISEDNYYTLDEKIKLMCKYGLAGIYSWRLDNDYNESFQMALWINDLFGCKFPWGK